MSPRRGTSRNHQLCTILMVTGVVAIAGCAPSNDETASTTLATTVTDSSEMIRTDEGSAEPETSSSTVTDSSVITRADEGLAEPQNSPATVSSTVPISVDAPNPPVESPAEQSNEAIETDGQSLLQDEFEFDDVSDQVRDLQELLGVTTDGHYGWLTLSAHRAALLEAGLPLTNLRPPPAKIDGISSQTIPPGGTVRVSGSGFAPGSNVQIALHSRPRLLVQAQVSDTGRFATTAEVPSSAEIGSHRLVAAGTDFLDDPADPSVPVIIGIDLSPPVLIDVTTSVSSVDITSGPATFDVDVSARDEGTGIIAGGLGFSGCGSGTGASWNDLGNIYPDGNIVTGSNTNGTWRVPVTVMAGIPACTLQLAVVDLCDAANQCVTIRDGLPPITVAVTRSD